MIDERFERDLAAVLRGMAGEEAPASLRYRLEAVTDAPTAGRRAWFAPLLQLSAAAVAVVTIGVLGWTFLPAPIVGPGSTPTPSPSSSATIPSPSPGPSETPGASATPAPTASPAPSGWTGLTWSAGVALPDGTRIGHIVAWQGGFTAVGLTGGGDPSSMRSAFFTSPDAVHWTVAQEVERQPLEQRALTAIVAVGDRLLAIDTLESVDCPGDTTCPPPDWTPDLWTSSDGTHWTLVDSPTWRATWSGGGPMSVVSGPAGVLAVGYQAQEHVFGQPTPPAIPLVAHSADGTTWEQADLAQGFDYAVFRDAVAFAGGFVIVGRDGVEDVRSEVVDPGNPTPLGMGRPAAWYSPDGIGWSVAQVDGIEIAGGELSEVVAGADGLFAIGAGSPSAGDATPSGWASSDGRTWRVIGRLGADLPDIDRVPPDNRGNTFLVSDGSHMVVLDRAAAGSETLAAWASTDGVTWARLTFTGASDLPQIGIYDPQSAAGTYVTSATVLPDRVVVAGSGAGTHSLWLAEAAGF